MDKSTSTNIDKIEILQKNVNGYLQRYINHFNNNEEFENILSEIEKKFNNEFEKQYILSNLEYSINLIIENIN